jgi:hypothetical protein
VIFIGLLTSAITLACANSHNIDDDKPPEVINGGIWSDHFYNPQLVMGDNIDVQMSHLLLKFDELLQWKQTWTRQFTMGDFYQTEAVSDRVRLASDGSGQYFITGTYMSTVFDAGTLVDWSSAQWNYSGIPDGIAVQFRTGFTPHPDETWTAWKAPNNLFHEYSCWYTYNTDNSGCLTNMSGIDSSAYIQYRADFNSNDPEKEVSLYDIDFLYGTHPFTGTALSMIIPPVDLREWESIFITSTTPASTTLVIDVLATDGTVLLNDAHNGDSLASIDPHRYPALQLKASFATVDQSLTPDVDAWGVSWTIMHKVNLPVILR